MEKNVPVFCTNADKIALNLCAKPQFCARGAITWMQMANWTRFRILHSIFRKNCLINGISLSSWPHTISSKKFSKLAGLPTFHFLRVSPAGQSRLLFTCYVPLKNLSRLSSLGLLNLSKIMTGQSTWSSVTLGRVHTTGLKPERFRNRSSCPCSDLFHCVHSFRNEPTTSRCDRSGTVPEPFRLALWCERSTGSVPERVQSARSLRVHVCLRARARA